MTYDNTNRISLWKNAKKETEKHPDYTGTVNVGGVEYFVDCWKKPPTAPEQAPVQPTKGVPAAGTAVKVTSAPALKVVSAGFEVTVPLPFAFTTSR